MDYAIKSIIAGKLVVQTLLEMRIIDLLEDVFQGREPGPQDVA